VATKYERHDDGTYKIDCTGCAAHCCKVNPRIPGGLVPMNDQGHCIHLKGNRCSIYATRPQVCRSHEARDLFKFGGTAEEWMEGNTRICDQLKKEAT
jgi:hypothetical protein